MYIDCSLGGAEHVAARLVALSTLFWIVAALNVSLDRDNSEFNCKNTGVALSMAL